MNHQFNLYKLKREVLRIGQQIHALAEFFYEPILRIFYEHRRATLLKTNHGQFAVAPENIKIALFLIFQPTEIAPSILSTCQYLINNGYAPLIISNAPLSNNAIAQLKSVSWRIVERPNFGYDFGGYRDGLWLLDKWSIKPETLVVLNDSVWFPVFPNCSFLHRAESRAEDFIGALRLEPYRDAVKNVGKKRPIFGSFFLLFKKPVLTHPAFINFWRDYRLTNSKYKTIRRGERHLSHTLFDAGIHSGFMLSREMFDALVTHAPASILLDTLNKLTTINPTLENQRLRCIERFEDSLSWASQARGLINALTEKQNIMETAPITMLVDFQFPFIKKALRPENIFAMKLIANAHEIGVAPQLTRHVIAEISQCVANTAQLNAPDLSTPMPSSSKSPTWQCVMVCWGDKYSVELINHLMMRIEQYATSPVRFVLICDTPKPDLRPDALIRDFPDFYMQPIMKRNGCQAKLAMFEAGVVPTDLPAVYVDLDTVILGDLGAALRFVPTPESVAILPSAIVPFGVFGQMLYQVSHQKRYARGNSSIVVFHPAHCAYIAAQFRTLFTQYPNFEFRPMVADERFISWVAQPFMQALPNSFVVKFPGEFMFYWRFWLFIKAKLPWVIRRRDGLVAITLNGLLIKPEHLVRLREGEVVVDNKHRQLVWTRKTLGSALDKILDFYQFVQSKH